MVHSGEFSADVEHDFAARTATSQRESGTEPFCVASSRVRPAHAGRCRVKFAVVDLSCGSEGSFFSAEAPVVRGAGAADLPDPGPDESAEAARSHAAGSGSGRRHGRFLTPGQRSPSGSARDPERPKLLHANHFRAACQSGRRSQRRGPGQGCRTAGFRHASARSSGHGASAAASAASGAQACVCRSGSAQNARCSKGSCRPENSESGSCCAAAGFLHPHFRWPVQGHGHS